MAALRLFITKLLSRSPLEFRIRFNKKFGRTNTLIWEHCCTEHLRAILSAIFLVQTTHYADRPVISPEPVQKTKRIKTIDQWITAFQTFVAIYTVQFKNDAPALMKYSQTVRDLAAKNVRWRYYDENFRFLRQ